MKKTIIICVGNILLFLLFGLTFLLPFSEIHQTEGTGFSATFTIFPFILIAYLIICPIAFYALRRSLNWNKKDNSEFAFSDEREKVIVSEAATTTYKVLFGGVLASIGIIGGAKFFALFSHLEISIYFISILLLTILLVVSTVSYCIKWCLEYRK